MLGLGSLLLASDALVSLKKRYPNAKLILISGKGVVPGIVPTGILGKSWRLKNRWLVDLEVYSKLTTIFSLWTMSLNRFGFQLNKDNYRSLARMMGVEEFTEFTIPVKDSAGRTNEAGKKYIAINNTCSELGGYLRKIPAQTLQAICTHILQTTPYNIAFTGAPSDFKDNEAFISQYLGNAGERVENIAGKYGFAEYYRFLHEECVLMLTIDSAPLFIALKTGLPTVSVWGPTNPTHRLAANTINSTRHKVHYLAVECSPCLHHTKVLPCGGNNFCMKNMDAANIHTQIQSVISAL
eukprot:gene36803-49640_t